MLTFFRTVVSVHERKRKMLYIILGGFVISFACARLYSTLIVTSFVFYHGFHIHHFYFGAILVWLGGVLAVLGTTKKSDYVASGLIGVGTGLFVDEVGLLLNCTSASRICAYAFPHNSDIVGALILLIVSLMLLTGIADYRTERRDGE